MERDSLRSLRVEILGALRKSLTDFTAEAELDPTRRQDANTARRVNWVIENGRKALDDLTFFFADRNVNPYLEQPIANYIWISCIFKDADSGKSK